MHTVTSTIGKRWPRFLPANRFVSSNLHSYASSSPAMPVPSSAVHNQAMHVESLACIYARHASCAEKPGSHRRLQDHALAYTPVQADSRSLCAATLCERLARLAWAVCLQVARQELLWRPWVEKRMVQTPDRRYDPDLVPPEWSQWLKMTRLEPPSEEEIAGCALLPAFLCVPGRLSFSYCSPTCNPEGTGGGPLL